MSSDQFAEVLVRLANGFGVALRPTERAGIDKIVRFCHRCSDQDIAQVARQIETGKSATVAELASRIRVSLQGRGEPIPCLELHIDSLGASDLKKLLSLLGQNPVAAKQANLERLHQVLNGKLPIKATENEQFDEAFKRFKAIRESLATLSLIDRSLPLRSLPKSVLKGVLQRLGYRTTGNQEALADRLLNPLEHIKINHQESELILNQT